MVSAIKAMCIEESKIVKKATSLIGFSGESKKSVGEISLPVYVDAATSLERFYVLDCQSPYNVILGRPWIHNIKAFPSTFTRFQLSIALQQLELIKGHLRNVTGWHSSHLA